MAEVFTPLLTFKVKLPHRFHLRCVVWESVPALYANTPEEAEKDYRAVFVPHDIANGKCVGTLHFAANQLTPGVVVHEITHAMSKYMDLVFDEHRASTTEHVVDEIDSTLRLAGLF